MARRKIKTQKSDNSPFPSSPQRPPTINLWIKYGPNLEGFAIFTFCARWAAKLYVDKALNGREYSDADNMGWRTSDDEQFQFKLTGDVDGLMKEDHSERDWKIPQPDLNSLLKAAGLETIQLKSEDDEPKKKRRVAKKNQPRGAVKKAREGLTTLTEICDDMGMSPRDARKILRGKIDKPDAGWAWPDDEVASVKKVLKGK